MTNFVVLGQLVLVVVVEMNISKVALSHYCCRTTVQSDSVSVSSQAGDSSSLVDSSRNILSVSRKGRLEQHTLQSRRKTGREGTSWTSCGRVFLHSVPMECS